MATNPERKPTEGARSGRLVSSSGRLNPQDAQAVIHEGAQRARNVAHALAMIALLLVRYAWVNVARKSLQRFKGQWLVIAARLLRVLFLLVQPHLQRWRTQVNETRSRAVRLLLIGLIKVAGPLEVGAARAVQAAKVQGASLAGKGMVPIAQLVRALGQTAGQVVKAGFSKAVAQKALGKLVMILQEADRK